MMLLGGIFIAAILVFVILFFALLAAYDRWREHYQARRQHVMHTTAADERIAAAERASMRKLHRYARPVYRPPAQKPHAAPDVPVNGIWLHPRVIEALGHATVDDLLDSIVTRALAPG